MSYAINGFKFKSKSFKDLNILIEKIKNKAEYSALEIVKMDIVFALGEFIMSKNKDQLIEDISYKINPECIQDKIEEAKNLNTLNEVLEFCYKEMEEEKINLFFNSSEDYMLLSNSLNRTSNLLKEFISDEFEDYSFSTYTGTTGQDKEFECLDEEYYKKIKDNLVNHSEEQFQDYISESESWLNSPSRKHFELVKSSWEKMTRDSFYINEHAIKIPIIKIGNFANERLENYGFKDSEKLSYIVSLLGVEFYKMAERSFIVKQIELTKPKITTASEYLKRDCEIRNLEGFKVDALNFTNEKINVFIKRYGDMKLKDFLTINLF